MSWSIIENYPFKTIVDNRQILIEVVDNWYGNGIVKIIASDNESSDTLEVIFDNVEGIAANVVTLYFFIELRISVALGFFCNTNVLPTYNEVWRHPNPKE